MVHTSSPDPVLASHLTALASRVHGLVGAFACGGSVELQSAVALLFADGSRVVVEPGWTKKTCAAVHWIKTRCSPAPYGHGRATRYDSDVRKALQLRAEGAFTVEGLDPAALGVLDVIGAELAPYDGTPITAELYSLNLYETHGHFVPHKDTPRGDDMIGTLVACLPVQFVGGALVLTHQTATRTFAWNLARAVTTGQSIVEWAAFFGDVDHEVQEVRAGNRLTLSWILRRNPIAPPAPAQRTTECEALVAELQNALNDPNFLPAGGVLAFPCAHMYAEGTEFGRSRTPLTETMARRLQGRDERIASAAMRLGLIVLLQPYLIEDCAEERWRLASLPTAREASVFTLNQLDPIGLEAFMPIERSLGFESDAVCWVLPDVHMRVLAKGGRQRASAATKFLGEPEFSTTGYFGNEGSSSGFYLYSALHVAVPPAARREHFGTPQKPG